MILNKFVFYFCCYVLNSIYLRFKMILLVICVIYINSFFVINFFWCMLLIVGVDENGGYEII